MKRFKSVGMALTIAGLAAGTLAAQTESPTDTSDERERVVKAGAVLDSIMASPDSEIPADLLREAQGVAVTPNVVKGAFIAGGRFGKGVVSARDENGRWGTPAFIDIGGGSFGLQLGVEATDLILVFKEPDGLTELLEDNLKLGAEAGAVVGPIGRHVGAGTNLTFDAPIYTYSRNKGVFAGVSLEGSVVGVDDSSTEEVYGEDVTASDILVKRSVSVNDVVRPFVDALKRHAPARATEYSLTDRSNEVERIQRVTSIPISRSISPGWSCRPRSPSP